MFFVETVFQYLLLLRSSSKVKQGKNCVCVYIILLWHHSVVIFLFCNNHYLVLKTISKLLRPQIHVEKNAEAGIKSIEKQCHFSDRLQCSLFFFFFLAAKQSPPAGD